MEGREATRVIDLDALGDAQRVELALQCDSGAFRLIMRRHNRRLYRVARAVTRDDSEAEDVVQEAYCLAFANLSRFRGDSSLASWLTRIALNEALGRLRRRRSTVELSTLDTESQDEMRIISFPLMTANAGRELFVKGLTQQAVSPMQPGLHRCLGYAEEIGGFLNTQFFDFAHDEDHAEPLRQIIDSVLHQTRDLSLRRNALRANGRQGLGATRTFIAVSRLTGSRDY